MTSAGLERGVKQFRDFLMLKSYMCAVQCVYMGLSIYLCTHYESLSRSYDVRVPISCHNATLPDLLAVISDWSKICELFSIHLKTYTVYTTVSVRVLNDLIQYLVVTTSSKA